MASGKFNSGFAHFFGGDMDYVNDAFSAYLITYTAYAPDLENDETIANIPEAAIIAETQLEGKYLNGLDFFADPIVFSAVAASTTPADAIVIFRDADLASNSYLLCIMDTDVSSELPVTLDGTDVVCNLPAGGFLQGN